MKIKKTGSRIEVYNGRALKTTGGLMKNDLIKRNGKIISKKMSNRMKNRLSGGFISRITSVFNDKVITKKYNLNYIKGSKSYNFYNNIKKGGGNYNIDSNKNTKMNINNILEEKEFLNNKQDNNIDFDKYSFYNKKESIIMKGKEPNDLDIILNLLEKNFNLCPIKRNLNETKIEFTHDIIQDLIVKSQKLNYNNNINKLINIFENIMKKNIIIYYLYLY